MFIILHNKKDGNEMLINIRLIESVYKNYVNFLGDNYAEVQESYDEIKEAMKKAMECDAE